MHKIELTNNIERKPTLFPTTSSHRHNLSSYISLNSFVTLCTYGSYLLYTKLQMDTNTQTHFFSSVAKLTSSENQHFNNSHEDAEPSAKHTTHTFNFSLTRMFLFFFSTTSDQTHTCLSSSSPPCLIKCLFLKKKNKSFLLHLYWRFFST